MEVIGDYAVPYGNTFTVVDPAIGKPVSASNFFTLLRLASEARHANGIPIGLEFRDELMALVCKEYPQECVNTDTDRIRHRHLGIHDVMVGTSVMARFLASGKQVVSQQEAERRASICVGCPNNTPFAMPCSGICAELKNLVIGIVGQVGTSKDAQLHACQVCHCFLPAAVYLPLEIQIPPLSENQKKQLETVGPCWKKESLMSK
jgi:hypothetical protein